MFLRLGSNLALPFCIGLKKVKVLLTQPCPTLCHPLGCSSPDSSVHGIPQARIAEWVLISSSEDRLDSKIKPRSPALQADSLPSEPSGKSVLQKVTSTWKLRVWPYLGVYIYILFFWLCLVFLAVHRLLLLRNTGSRAHGLSSCGSRAQLPCSVWDLISLIKDWSIVPHIGRWIF